MEGFSEDFLKNMVVCMVLLLTLKLYQAMEFSKTEFKDQSIGRAQGGCSVHTIPYFSKNLQRSPPMFWIKDLLSIFIEGNYHVFF